MENTFSVLVVDDDHISRRLLAKALTTEGHRVVSVENGRKALDSYRNEFFPIVLTERNSSCISSDLLDLSYIQ